MKKNLKPNFGRFRAEIAIILVAAIVLSIGCFASFGVSAVTEDLALDLANGPDYTFNGNEWDPQLSVDAASNLTVSSDINTIKLDIKMPDYNTLKDYMSAGSRSSLGGGSFTYDYSLDLGIYFSGTGVTGVGVTQGDLKNAFNENAAALGNGETVTLTLPVSGTFESDAVITGINVMLAHDSAAANFSGKSISISNFIFNPKVDLQASESALVLVDGPDYTFNGNNWDPQLSVDAKSNLTVSEDYDTIKFDIKMPDYNTLKNYMSAGSRSTVGGGEFGYGGTDLGIYFSGTGVTGVGVTQYDLFNIFDANAAALGNGETVTLTLPVSGTFTEGGVITGIRIMLAHDSAANNFNGKSISISNIEFNPKDPVYALELKDGPDYTFNGNNWDPQLVIDAKTELQTSSKFDIMTLDIKMPDYDTLKKYMSAGSRSSLGGGGFTYDAEKDLGIYFSGTGVSSAGVTQYDLIWVAFKDNAEKLAAGETVTLTLPISGAFEDGGVITGIKMMLAHDAAASNFNGKSISISNIVFKNAEESGGVVGEDQVELKKGPNYTLSGAEWGPQLVINTKKFDLKNTYKYMQIELTVSDIDAVLENFTIGSPSVLGGGSWGYGGDDLGIYFDGTNVEGIGIRQTDLKDALNKYRDDFLKGKTVTLEMPFSGDIPDDAAITAIRFCMSHDFAARNLDGVEFNISKLTFSEESIVKEPEPVVLTKDDIKSTDTNTTVVDFDTKRIYVISNSTVGDLMDRVSLSDGLKSMVTYEGTRMANKSKLINDYDFRYVVIVSIDQEVEFAVIPCAKKAGVIDITSPIVDNKNVGGETGNISSTDDITDDTLFDDVDYEPTFNDYENSFTGYGDSTLTEDVGENVIISSSSGGKNKIVKQTVTENLPLYNTWMLVILIAATFLAGAAVMFIIDLIRFKKIALFKKKV